MSADRAMVKLVGLSKIDKLDLEELLGEDAVEVQEQLSLGERYGEMGLVEVVVVVTPPLAMLLIAWLGRPERRATFEEVKVEVKAKGDMQWSMVKYQVSDKEPIPKALIEKLGDILGQDRLKGILDRLPEGR
jgi:hypothetical protein